MATRVPTTSLAPLPALVVALVAAACTAPPPKEHAMLADPEYASCGNCHMADYRGARDHVGKKPLTCGVCHQEVGWKPRWVNHPWWLTGAHANLDCARCHQGDPAVFKGTSSECVSCHRAEYEAAKEHTARFAVTCEECHATVAWKPAYWSDETVAAAEAADAGQAPVDAVDAGAPADAGALRDAGVAARPTPARVTPHPSGVPVTTAKPPPATTTPPPDVTTHASGRR